MTRPLSEWEAYQRRLERDARRTAIFSWLAMLAGAVLIVLTLWLAYVGLVALCGA